MLNKKKLNGERSKLSEVGKQLFEMFDQEGSGTISVSEVAETFGKLGKNWDMHEVHMFVSFHHMYMYVCMYVYVYVYIYMYISYVFFCDIETECTRIYGNADGCTFISGFCLVFLAFCLARF